MLPTAKVTESTFSAVYRGALPNKLLCSVQHPYIAEESAFSTLSYAKLARPVTDDEADGSSFSHRGTLPKKHRGVLQGIYASCGRNILVGPIG